MEKNIEDLLKPRFKLVLDFPHNSMNVGDIIEIDQNETWDRVIEIECKSYPHIYKPLAWWEDREVSEMPTHVKYIGTGNISVLTEQMWKYPAVMEDYLPATESDFITFNKQTN